MPSNSDINRANARHSTGPKTPEGKKRSALNALRHGLTGQIVVMPTEDLQAYQLHVKSFTGEYNPQGPTEASLVQAIADTSWRLNRVAALETNLLTMGVASNLSPIHDAPPQVQDAFSIAAAIESQSKALANLSMHSQRLSRQFEKAVAQLRELQKTRKAQENSELDELADIIQMYEDNGETYDPSADGFVFSESQIAAARCTRKRELLAAEAYTYRYESAAA